MIKLRAVLEMLTKGTDKAKKEVGQINDELDQAADNAARMNRTLSQTKTGQSAMARAGVADTSSPGSTRAYRTQRGVTGTRGAEGRDFAAMAQGGGGQGFVAAYATLAANLFAVTAAFQALNNAAKTEQLTKGLELMGARSGVSLKLVASNLKEITDNALSTADAMRAVATASSAGMSSTEIERLGKVARGASLALGRDMSDSMDRLIRGVTKLEPELLDEIGIMVRLDDAVEVYAKKNNVAASSLTNLQRRQAFANAVLEEGERKFGAINDQIASNPYDKLSSALRDLGTEILSLTNNILMPFIKLITEIPILGLVPALGVLSQTLAKVTPNLDSFYDKVEARSAKLTARRDFVSSLIPEAEAQVAVAKFASPDQEDAKKSLIRLQGQELNLQAQINAQNKQAQIIENFKETQRSRGLLSALKELAVSQANITQNNNAFIQEDLARKKAIIQQNYLNNLNKWGLMIATKELAIAQAQLRVEQQRLGTQAGITNLTKIRIGLTAIGGAAEFLMSALSRVLIVITLVTAAISLGVAAFKYFFPPTEAQERLKKYKEDMKELVESAKETRNQLQYLSAGEGQDALVNSSLAILDNLKKQRNLEAEIARARKLASANVEPLLTDTSPAGVMASTAIVQSQAFGGRMLADAEKFANELEKLPIEAQELYLALKEIAPEQAGIVRKALEEGKSREAVLDFLIKQEPLIKKLQGLNANLSASTKTIVDEWNNLKIKELDTGFTKINSAFQDITKMISQLEKPLTFKTNTAIFDQLKAIGSDNILSTLNAAKNVGVKINPVDEARINMFVDKLKSIQDLEIRIDAGGLDGIIARVEKFMLGKKVAESAAGVAEILGKTAGKTEDILVANLLSEKIAANTAAINAANLDIEIKRLDIVRKRANAENDIIGVSIKEDNLIKSIVDSSRLLEDATIARKKATNDILALQKSQDTLILQSSRVGINPAEKAFIDGQIASNNALLAIKKQQAELDVEAAKEAFAISMRKTSALTNNIILAQSETTLLGQGAEITAELLSAENARLAVVDKKLNMLREELSLQSQLRDAQLTTARQIAEAEAAKRGGTVGPQKERELAITAAQNTLTNLEDQKILLAKEEKLMIEKMKLEQTILGLRLAAAELELTNAINTAPPGTDTTYASDQLESIGEAKGILSRVFVEEKKYLEDSFKTKQAILDTQIQGQNAVLGALPKNAREVADRLVEGLKSGLGATLGGIGLTGAAADFYAKESQGIINSGMSKEDRENALANIRSMSSELQGQQILAEGLAGIYGNLTSGIEGAFMAMIDGSKSAKEAFGEMAAAIIKDIAAMIIRLLVFKAIEMGLNMILPGSGTAVSAGSNIAPRALHSVPGKANGGIIALANGGIMDARGGLQGIVSKPTYLVGEGRYNEAVVPLPNGKSIPVQMHGGSSQNNNVAVNVNVSNSGQVQTETQGQDMGNLGQAIAVAVQKELIAQKMPGGILNRYGAA